MAKREILAGSVDQTIDIFIQDSSSTTGGGLTGLVFNTASLVCYYRKGATGTPTALTLATQTVGGAHSDGGFVAVDGTNMPGVYRLDLSDTIVATAGMVTIMLKGATNMAPCVLEIEVVSVNKFDSVRMGLTALPNAAAEAAGGLYTRGTGAGQINQANNGQIDTNVLRIAGTLVDTNSAQIGVNLVNIAGAAVNTATAQIGAQVVTHTAAAKAEIESEVNDALVVQRLDELLNADSDIDGAAPPTVGSVFHELMTKTAGSFTFDQTTDSLEAIADSGGGGPTAAQIATAVWQDTTAGDFTVASSIGKSLYTSVVPGAAGGLFIAGSNAATTVNITGNITGNLTGSIGSLATQAKTDVENAVWDALPAFHGTADSFATTFVEISNAVSSLVPVSQATVQDVAATTTVFKTSLTEVSNFWNDALLTFTSGALSGQSKPVLSYSSVNGTITLDEPLTSAPANGVTFAIKADHIHPVSQIADGIWDEARAGHVSAGTFGEYVLVNGADIRTAVGLATANLDTQLTAIDDLIDTEVAAIKAKTDQLTFTNANKVDSALLAINDLATVVAQKIAHVVLRRTMANVEAAVDGGDTLDVSSIYGFIQQAQESNTTANAGKLTVYKTDGTTELAQRTITTNAAADPTTGIS